MRTRPFRQLTRLCIWVGLLASARAIAGDRLRDTSNKADLLIVAPASFVSTLDSLAAFRGRQGLLVRVATTDSIYAEFPDTAGLRMSIRQFLMYAHQQWSDPKPAYALLAGSTDLIPPYRVQSYFAYDTSFHEDSVAEDVWYATAIGETKPRPLFALGRYPARDTQELASMIEKTMLFEAQYPTAPPDRDLVIVTSGTVSDYGVFESFAEQLAARTNAYSCSVRRIDARAASPFAGTHSDLLAAADSNILYLCYAGHGKASVWLNQMMVPSYADSLNASGMPFILTGLTSTQTIDPPDSPSIAHALMARNHAGAAAIFAPSGLEFASFMEDILSLFYDRAVSSSPGRLGDIALAIYRASVNDDAQFRYALLGDPSMKLPAFTERASVDDHQGALLPRTGELVVVPMPARDQVTFRFLAQSDGPVQIEIVDMLGKIVRSIDVAHPSGGAVSIPVSAQDLSPGQYVGRVRSGATRLTAPFIIAR